MTTNTALLIPNNAFSEVPDRANACESQILLCKVLTRQDGAITSC